MKKQSSKIAQTCFRFNWKDGRFERLNVFENLIVYTTILVVTQLSYCLNSCGFSMSETIYGRFSQNIILPYLISYSFDNRDFVSYLFRTYIIFMQSIAKPHNIYLKLHISETLSEFQLKLFITCMQTMRSMQQNI